MASHDHPSLTVDVAILTATGGGLHALLVRRDEDPGRGRYALPGGSVGRDESLDRAAERVLAAKAGLEGVFLEQLYTFGAPDRVPRARVVTVAHYALVDEERLAGAGLLAAAGPGSGGSGDASDPAILARLGVPWLDEEGGAVGAEAPDGAAVALALDHAEILGTAVKRLRGKLDYAPIGFQLLPERFTLRRLQEVHETILGRRLNKDSFRRRMLASAQIAPTGEREEETPHRPAELYRFTRHSAV